MSKNILLAVDTAAHDAARHVVTAADMTDLPRMPLGSVAARLLHMATRPVLIVPQPARGE